MIRLTKLADYGIVLLSHVANRLPGEIFTAKQLADAEQIPAPMASKILKILARQGLLLAHRGVNGGYCLGRRAEDITVADVIRALEGPIALTECIEVSDSDCAIELGCPVKSNWQRINDAVIGALEQIKISEMAPPSCCSEAPETLQIMLPRERTESAVAV